MQRNGCDKEGVDTQMIPRRASRFEPKAFQSESVVLFEAIILVQAGWREL